MYVMNYFFDNIVHYSGKLNLCVPTTSEVDTWSEKQQVSYLNLGNLRETLSGKAKTSIS